MLRCAHPACTFLVHVKLQLLPRLVNIGSVALLKFARRNDVLWSQLGFFFTMDATTDDTYGSVLAT